MEWIKNMGLKKAFVLLSVLGIIVALLLIIMVFTVLNSVRAQYPLGGIAIDSGGVVRQLESPTTEQEKIIKVLDYVGLIACIVIPVSCLGAASLIFYHYKLKMPISVLQMGTARIREHDLAFSIPKVSADELGQVCAAFETMRGELVRTNQELWRQAEERRRLNAAFAHDLRNPVTVLKGTVKLLRQNTVDEQAIDRLEIYTQRIENYVEAMSGIQRLEQLPVQPKEMSCVELRVEVEDTARLLVPAAEIQVGGIGVDSKTAHVSVDHGLFLTVAENLIGNAARYAKRKIEIEIGMREGNLILSVADDGIGYPAELIQNGPKPFGKMEENGAHFGMGLYTSRMLCTKHGGTLILENRDDGGAKATAIFLAGE